MKVGLKNSLSQGNQNYFTDMREGDGVVINNDPYQGHSSSTSGRATTTNGTYREVTHIKLVHWNAQGAITKTSAIKTTIVQDDLGIVIKQVTRYTRRLDGLPNLRIHGYQTYHITMDEGRLGMVTMMKHTIPSEEAEQLHLGERKSFGPKEMAHTTRVLGTLPRTHYDSYKKHKHRVDK